MQELHRSTVCAVGVIEECFGDIEARTVESGIPGNSENACQTSRG
jgi:hypothetical protein